MWVTDLFLSLPQLPLLLLVIYLFRDSLKAVFGVEGGVFVMIVAVIGGLRWMPVARLVRAQFLSLREKEFVEAARAPGASKWHLVDAPHPAERASGPVIVAGTIEVSSAIIAESTLSFLGLGFPPDIPTWGRMLFDAKDHLDVAPHWALFPGAAIFLTVLSINFIGDGLRDALDPRRVIVMRRRRHSDAMIQTPDPLRREPAHLLPGRRRMARGRARRLLRHRPEARRSRSSANPARARASRRSRSCG